jgi:hypothetical protein
LGLPERASELAVQIASRQAKVAQIAVAELPRTPQIADSAAPQLPQPDHAGALVRLWRE